MKVCILGATGKTGQRLVRRALERDHHVTAVVRNAERAAVLQHENLSVRADAFSDDEALRNVMRDQDVVINVAGYVADTANFVPLVQRVIRAAEAALGRDGRLWLFGGAALLDVPGSPRMTLDLPGVPRVYEAHRTNFEAVRRSQLDWSILCPGPMIESPDGQATSGLILSEDVWPVPRPTHTRFLPRVALALAFRQAVSRLTIYYEDAAEVVLDHLSASDRFSRRRVGIALPEGQARHKLQGSHPTT